MRRPHGEGLQAEQALGELGSLARPQGARGVSRGEGFEPPGVQRQLRSLDDRPDLLPHQLGVPGAVLGVVVEQRRELPQPDLALGREAFPDRPDEVVDHGAEEREGRRLARSLAARGKAAVDALAQAPEALVVREEQLPAPVARPAQEVVDRERGLAAAGGAREQHGRLQLEDGGLLARQVQVQLERVGATGSGGSAPTPRRRGPASAAGRGPVAPSRRRRPGRSRREARRRGRATARSCSDSLAKSRNGASAGLMRRAAAPMSSCGTRAQT